MQEVYDELEKRGEIGNFIMKEGKRVGPKPFKEYPKFIKLGDGTHRVVQSLKEEAEVIGDGNTERVLAHDPLREEKRALAAQEEELRKAAEESKKLNIELREQLDKLKAIEKKEEPDPEPSVLAPSVPKREAPPVFASDVASGASSEASVLNPMSESEKPSVDLLTAPKPDFSKAPLKL